MASFANRVAGALRLQPATFEDLEHDPRATGQAAIIIAAVAIARGIAVRSHTGFAFLLLFGFVGWAVGSAVIWIVGTRLLRGRNTEADLGQLLRTVGFAQTPNVLAIAGVVPVLGWVLGIIGMLWSLAALVVAVRQALDYEDTVRAMVVCVVAWLLMLLITMLATLMGYGTVVY